MKPTSRGGPERPLSTCLANHASLAAMENVGLLYMTVVVAAWMLSTWRAGIWLPRGSGSRREKTRDAPPVAPSPRPEFAADAAVIAADIDRSHDDLYLEGTSLVRAFLGDRALRLDPERLNRGLALLEHVVALNPTNWAAMWTLGMGYRLTSSFLRSGEFFARLRGRP